MPSSQDTCVPCLPGKQRAGIDGVLCFPLPGTPALPLLSQWMEAGGCPTPLPKEGQRSPEALALPNFPGSTDTMLGSLPSL